MTNETRRSFHGLAELVLAGPQHRRSGTIRLRVTPTGFATVADPVLAVEADALVVGDRRFPLAGQTLADLATEADVEVGAPKDLYSDGSGASPGDRVVTDGAAELLAALTTGDAALRRLTTDAAPVLWPEHFDVGVSLDEVNYGVSTGDSAIDEPYAYVGPWKPREGAFWNVSFGAAVPLRDLGDTAGVFAFFEEGRSRAAE
ncbi:hypothetical protein ACFFX1_32025 [Dactylosporangium sucinum]|uniref:Uncharacterized protein n=1 Tax=Dactylosporangium sucinum TaxID=1424081 RepID=A0A917WLT6_9ACTN|nr:hypothetical protein [Dactylosporangium sucinum]GGM13746.1 hypothetical protein GCM10007977_013530 [Dactylosporangium sucinum]